MALLKLRYSPDPILKKKSVIVENINDNTRKFMDDMLETMYHSKGIGLAAVQVGVLKRILVMDVERGSERYPDQNNASHEPNPIFIVNPEITWQSEELNHYEEGCLSFPQQYADVARPKQVKISYLDYHGNEQILEADNLLATCVQHEIDHLNGITFVDHISRLKRNRILKKLSKLS